MALFGEAIQQAAGADDELTSALIAARNEDATAVVKLWQCVLESKDFGRYGSNTNSSLFLEQYSTASLIDDRPRSFRLFLDSHGGECQLLMPLGGVYFDSLNNDEVLLTLEGNSKWSVRTVSPWEYCYAQLGERFLKLQSPKADSEIRFEPWPFLHTVIGESPLRVTWNSPTASLHIEKGNGTEVHLAARTPNDQRRFGSILSELAVKAKTNNFWMCHRCFVVDRESLLRGRRPSIQQLIPKLGAEDRLRDPTPVDVKVSMSPEFAAAADRLEEFYRLRIEDDRPVVSSDFRSCFEENLFRVAFVLKKSQSASSPEAIRSLHENSAKLLLSELNGHIGSLKKQFKHALGTVILSTIRQYWPCSWSEFYLRDLLRRCGRFQPRLF